MARLCSMLSGTLTGKVQNRGYLSGWGESHLTRLGPGLGGT